jgi:hypothetical protein
MFKHGKTDANQTAIKKRFEELGCSVLSLASLGKGVCDLLVANENGTFLCEVKSPKGVLTPDQVHFWALWTGKKCIVRYPQQCFQVLKEMGCINE